MSADRSLALDRETSNLSALLSEGISEPGKGGNELLLSLKSVLLEPLRVLLTLLALLIS